MGERYRCFHDNGGHLGTFKSVHVALIPRNATRVCQIKTVFSFSTAKALTPVQVKFSVLYPWPLQTCNLA